MKTVEMKSRLHARSGTNFTEVSLGTARWADAAGAEGDIACRQVFEAAWAAGIRHFDTAPYYGTGLAEHRLGEALRWKDRKDYVLSTKVGIDLDPHNRRPAIARFYKEKLDFAPVCDYSATGIRASLDTSLHRMGVSSAEIAYMHGLSVCPGGLDLALAEGMPALMGLREDGLLKMVGVGANTPAIANSVIERFDIDILLFAGGMSLADHAGAGDVIAECRRRGIGVICASPFANGKYFAPGNAPFRDRLGKICTDYGVSEGAAIVGFGLLPDCAVSVLWSTRTPENVGRTLASYGEEVPDAFWDACVTAGIVAPYVLENRVAALQPAERN